MDNLKYYSKQDTASNSRYTNLIEGSQSKNVNMNFVYTTTGGTVNQNDIVFSPKSVPNEVIANAHRSNAIISGHVTPATGIKALKIGMPTLKKGSVSDNPTSIFCETSRILYVGKYNELHEEMFRNENYHCTFAETEFHALKLLKKRRYDMIVANFEMQSIDGLKFMDVVALIPNNEDIPFVFIKNSEIQDSVVNEGELNGIYFVKSEQPNLLLSCVVMIMEKIAAGRFPLRSNLPDSFETRVLMEVREFVMQHIEDETKTAGDIASALKYTQRNLSAIIKEETNLSLVQYVLKIRIVEACRLIVNKKVRSINEARYAVGIDSASYFNKKFKRYFGFSPNMLKQ